MSPSNIFKRNKKTTLPKTNKAAKSKKTVAKSKPVKKDRPVVKNRTRKKTIVKKQAEKSSEPTSIPVESTIVAKRAKDSTPEEVDISMEEVQQDTMSEEIQNQVPDVDDTVHVQENISPIQDIKEEVVGSTENNLSPTKEEQKEEVKGTESSTQEDSQTNPPAKEQPKKPAAKVASIVRKKQTMEIDNIKKRSKLGKAVIAPPPGYANRLRKAAAASSSTTSSAPPNAIQTELPSEKEDRRKKKEKTDRFERVDRDKGEKVRAPKKRTRTKLRTPKMEIKIDDYQYQNRRPKRKRGGKKKSSPKPRAEKRKVVMSEQITVSDFAHQMSVKAKEIIKKLLTFEMICKPEETIDFDTATLIAEGYEYEVINEVQTEEDFMIEEAQAEEGDPRPAVVTIMGHVDHGKTTLLDSIRKSNVAKGEAGGITQHISAYQVQKNGQSITFIDTPGHKAFTAMRSRGAKVTDIVVLVVAADDGVMPQTEEALSHARAAGVDIVVAINKCDKPNSNPERVKQELMARDLVPEEYGGDTIFVELSALKGTGIDNLLENLILVAEMNELKAVQDSHAQGTVLEARLDKGRGPVATIIVKSGTLKRGDSLVLGTVCGRVRAMTDHNGKTLKQALPSTPLEIIGLEAVPGAGDEFTVVKNDKDARALAALRINRQKQKEASKPQKLTLEQLLMHQEKGEVLTLNLILKTDVGGTLEAIKGALDKIDIEGTEIKTLHSSVGAITEGDITLAHTYGAIVIGFNVRPDSKARKAVSRLSVDIKTYKLIHELETNIRKALKGMLSPETEEKVQALAEV
ncbi:MAG: translation initiation factor IF-2, partial [Deltaproteobacteria bacterium]|nr:translation initiation factor IF-2 [Deltaproteobacteria bacterium]